MAQVQAIAVQGVALYVGASGSPEGFSAFIVNISKMSMATKAKVVDVSNVTNLLNRKLPTLIDAGDLTIDIFWVMEEVTHRNSAGTPGSPGVPDGLRYLVLARPNGQPIRADFQIIYPDGNNSTDAFSGYVTSFQMTGNVADVFHATVMIAIDGPTVSFV